MNIFKQERWKNWTRNTPTEVLVLIDFAIEQHAQHPKNPGYWWVKPCLGENGWPPFHEPRKAGGWNVFLPAFNWDGLVAAHGDARIALHNQLALLFPDTQLDFPPPMIPIAPGTFLLGQNLTEKGHVTTLTRPYAIQATPVTQGLYFSLTGEKPPPDSRANRPATLVSWVRAVDFCNQLSSLLGYSHAYQVFPTSPNNTRFDPQATGFRLPTEAEWEFAARGGENFRYAGSDDIDTVAWHWRSSMGQYPEVAQKNPNGYGLYDMSGLVSEWCWDRMGDLTGGIDPAGLASGSKRVARGQYWGSQPAPLTTRTELDLRTAGYGFGFRLARTLP